MIDQLVENVAASQPLPISLDNTYLARPPCKVTPISPLADLQLTVKSPSSTALERLQSTAIAVAMVLPSRLLWKRSLECPKVRARIYCRLISRSHESHDQRQTSQGKLFGHADLPLY